MFGVRIALPYAQVTPALVVGEENDELGFRASPHERTMET